MREYVGPAILMVAAAAGIGATRGRLAYEHHHVRETNDVYALPPPEQVVTLSLGYRAALADILWADVLVSQGLHMQEKRRYDNVMPLLDAINALDPSFRSPYLLADALITFQSGGTSPEEARRVREILERGTRALPLDAEIWLALGGFVGYMAPASYLKDEAEAQQWRLDAAQMLARAAELSGDQSNIAWQALGGAGLLGRAGERDAQINFFKRACGVSDDPEFKEECDKKLAALLGEELAAKYAERGRAFEQLWKHDLKFIVLTELLVVGPPRDADYCAGGTHEAEPRCAGTWKDWAERIDATSK